MRIEERNADKFRTEIMKHLVTIILFISFNYLSFGNTNPIWGQTGHRVVGAIADNYLKPSTKRALKKLLDHESLALVSTYADEIKSDDRYDKFKPWHYVNMPFDSTYEASEKNPEGDLVTGIAYCKAIITDDKNKQQQQQRNDDNDDNDDGPDANVVPIVEAPPSSRTMCWASSGLFSRNHSNRFRKPGSFSRSLW